MSRLTKWFRKSIRWLRRGADEFKEHENEIKRGIELAKQISAILETSGVNTGVIRDVLQALDGAERMHGTHTSFWDHVERGATVDNGIFLPRDECVYGMHWKNGFDGLKQRFGLERPDDDNENEPLPPGPDGLPEPNEGR